MAEDTKKPVYFDLERKHRVERLTELIGQLIDGSKEIDAAPSVDVMLAILARAVVLSKQIDIDENEFFDVVVKMYGWTHIETVERH